MKMDREFYQSLIGSLNTYYPQISTLYVANVHEAREFWNRYELYKLFGPLPNVEDRTYLENLYFLVVNYSQTLQDFCLTFSWYTELFFINPETNKSRFADEFVNLVNTFLRNLGLQDLSGEQKNSIFNFIINFSAYEIFPALLIENLSFNKQKIGTLYRKALMNGLKNIPQDSQEYYQLKDLYAKIRNKTYEFFTRKNRPMYDLLDQRGLTQIYESSFNASFEKQTVNVDNIDKEYRQAVQAIYKSKIDTLLDDTYFSVISGIIGLDEYLSSTLREYLRNAL
jgi:hypothetical protein